MTSGLVPEPDAGEVPWHRPWARREDADEVEERYQQSLWLHDRQGWDERTRLDNSWSMPKTRTKTMTVRAVGRHSVEFIGPAGAIVNACMATGARWMKSHLKGGGWLVRESGADDVMAYLENQGYRLDVVLVTGRAVAKSEWRASIVSPHFPRDLRWLRGTLVCPLPLVRPDGTLSASREEMVRRTGLPPRTLGYHLKRATKDCWLTHETVGGSGRRAIFRASIPQKLQATDCPQQGKVAGNALVPNSAEVAGSLVACSKIERTQVSTWL